MHLFGAVEQSCPALFDGDESNGEFQRRTLEFFGKAWLMAFQTLTGDDWCNQMYAYVNVHGVHAARPSPIPSLASKPPIPIIHPALWATL